MLTRERKTKTLSTARAEVEKLAAANLTQCSAADELTAADRLADVRCCLDHLREEAESLGRNAVSLSSTVV